MFQNRKLVIIKNFKIAIHPAQSQMSVHKPRMHSPMGTAPTIQETINI